MGVAAGAPSEEPDNVLPRMIRILQPNENFANNKATSARFTIWNYLPISLGDVFDPRYKITNIFFLVAGALQLVPVLTLSGGTSTIWINVGVQIAQDIIIMGIADLAKHRVDAKTNRTKVERMHGGSGDEFRAATWADVKVGDVVKIHDREALPADVLFLRGPDPDPGQAWLNTKPLDGETDLKLRIANKQVVSLLTDDAPATVAGVLRNGIFRAEAPNDKVNDFSGQLQLEGHAPLIVARQNIMLRGTQLRSTSWIYGLVLATGRETKANFGSKGARVKHPTTLRLFGNDLYCVFVLILVFCALGAALQYPILGSEIARKWYLQGDDGVDEFRNFAVSFFRYFLLVYLFIPTNLFAILPQARRRPRP